MAYVWGVDSASPVDNRLLQCVLTRFGKPLFWGRYLSTVPRAASGLTRAEIAFLHRQNIKVLPIYNAFRSAVGYGNGKTVAREAVRYALRLGISRGTYLFANIEHYFRIDEGWIRAWVDTIRMSGYKPGIYHDPIRGQFSKAFCSAVKKDARVRRETVLWSAQPEITTTGPRNAPAFAPNRPPCRGNVWAWQYGRDSRVCPIDTNLIDSRLYNQLF
ncbi:DUF1906 domain-containing protein [Heliobacterium undosum]|uniref:DUF1906 domain-containing protein n=1 Tax=Heliomicrobium undosum TaxID=121734 RepID=A0A845L193_9FIRM|nr:glycoside hydrolase domain-containing protein [Heliomicrobium undosum]MZP30322.1 DUF1906 domain-containing protein [Heliomicrobium undosum]